MTNVSVGVTGVTAAGATQDEYEFTQNWFEYGQMIWPEIKKFIPQREFRHFLEIGSFEGRSAVWAAENIMRAGDRITCIDTWEGGEEHLSIDMQEVERRFDRNVNKMCNKKHVILNKIKSESHVALAKLMRHMEEDDLCDFIYIDGSHQAPDVLTDAVMAWKMLRNDGVMIFDDYLWGNPANPIHRPKMAIDAFMNLFGAQIGVMHISYQMVIKKVLR